MAIVNRGILWMERAIIVGAFSIMVVVTFAQVVARFIFNDPISWSEEVARFLFVWITMMGASHAVAYSKHFCVDFLISRFSPAGQRRVGWFISICVLLFAILMLGYGGYVTQFTRFQVSPALLLPMTYPYLCIPLAGFFTIIHVIANLAAGRNEAAAETAAEIARAGGEGSKSC